MRIIQDNKKIFQNFISLAFLQGTNFVIPLLLTPYLQLTLGWEKFGVVSVAQSVMLLLVTFIDYGFNISATREVALNKDDSSKLSEIVSKTLLVKLILSIFAFAVLMLLVSIVPKFNEHLSLFLLSYPFVIGQSFLPVFFFHGIEKMKYLTYLNLVAKFLTVILVLHFIREQQNYSWVWCLFGLANLFSSVIGYYWIVSWFKLRFYFVNKILIINELKYNFSLFISNLATISYINSNILILSFVASDRVVGYYSFAEKVIFASRQPLVIFSQAIYPHLCKLATESHLAIQKFFRRVYIPFIILIFLMCLIIFFAPSYVPLLFPTFSKETLTLIQWLSLISFIVGLNIPAYQILLVYDLKKSYTSVLILGSFLNILLNLPLSYLWQAKGTALSVIITETFVTLTFYGFLYKKHAHYKLF
jgi:PST family polysaccharide transporter